MTYTLTRSTANVFRLAVFLLLLGLSASQAQQQLYTPVSSGYSWRDNANEANGVFFTVGPTNIVVSHLGYFNGTNNVHAPGGLKSHHPVGIYAGNYTASSYVTNLNILGQVDVPAGTNAYYYNNFYWVQLDPPMILKANTGYLLAGQAYNNDGDYWQDATVSAAGTAAWNTAYVGTSTTRFGAYGPSSTTWPLAGTSIFTRNGLSKAYVMPMLGNLPQGPATVVLVSTNTVYLTGGQTLTVQGFACGQTVITNQWWQNGVAVSGQTSSTLSIPNVSAANNGTYYLTVTNSLGGEQSASINVVVYTFPTNLVVSPATYGQTETLYAGATANFVVSSVNGISPFTYQWYTNGVLDGSAASTNYSMPNMQSTSPTTFACVVANADGSVTNTWNVSVVPQPTATYPATVLADSPIGYWRLNEPDNTLGDGNANVVANDYWGGNSGVYTNTILLGQSGYAQGVANLYGYTPATDPESSALFGNYPTTTTPSTPNSFAGDVSNVGFGTATNTSATFSVEAWVKGPVGQIGGAGLVAKGYGNGGEQFDLDIASNSPTSSVFRFFVRDAGGVVHGPTSTFTTDGNWHHVVGVVDEVNSNIFLYVDSQSRWNSACSPSNGILSSTAPMSIGARRSSSTSQYDLQFNGNINDVAIYNFALSSNQVLSHYTAAGIPPRFTVKSVSATNVNQGTELIVPTTAIGLLPVNYQWYDVTAGYPGVPLANQTSATLDIPNIQASNFNGHTLALIASNAFGKATNQLALAVYSVPFFSQQPLPTQSLYAGGTATWTIATVGPQPISYYWFSNGVAIPFANSATLTLSNLQAGANYSCLASNSLGTTTSSVVKVTILPKPTAPYPLAVLADHPVSYWRLNESDNTVGNNGAVANDYWGGNSGSYSNTILGQTGYSSGLASQIGYSTPSDPTETAAEFGYYPSAYATSNYVANIPNINFATANASANFSVEAWVNGDSGQDGLNIGGGAIVAKGAWAAEQFTLDTPGGPTYPFRFTTRDANNNLRSVSTNACYPDGRWHHLVGVLDETHSNLCLYVDGVKVATTSMPTATNGVLSSSVPTSIGCRLNSGGVYAQQFLGKINDVAIYNYALSSNQVAAHYVAAGVPPTFTLQPPSYTNVNEGTTLVIPTQVLGTQNLNYQWYDVTTGSPGVPLAGQTSATLDIPNISQAQYNGHSLELIVTNIYGQATAYVSLNVNSGPPNSVTVTPANPPPAYVGSLTLFTATAQGTQPFGYYWSLDGTTIDGVNSSSFTYTNVLGSHTITCLVSNSVGSSSGSASATATALPSDTYGMQILNDEPVAFWRLDEALGSGVAYDYVGGHNAYYSYSVSGQPGISPTNAAETATGFGMNGYGSDSMAQEYDQSYSGIPNVDFSSQGVNAHFSVEAWVKAPAGQMNNAGIITKGYGNGGEQFCVDVTGGHFQFFVRSASGTVRTAQSSNMGPDGTWHHLVAVCDEANAAVRLFIDGNTNATGAMTPGEGILAPLPNGSPVLTSIGARMSSSTDYNYSDQMSNSVIGQVAVYDYALSSSQILAHYAAAALPPGITLQPSPASYTRYQGAGFSYSVAASGYPPLAYQWYKNGVAIPGQTGTSLYFANTAPSNSGSYTVVVTNVFGATTSSVATLNIVVPDTAYETQVLAKNAADYWRFNETGGTTAYDYIGGLNGQYGTGTTYGVPGPQAPAFQFESTNTAVAMDHVDGGVNSYVTGPTLNYSNNTFTITAWVYPTSDVTNYQGVVFTRASTYAKGITYIAVPGRNNMIGYTWNQNNINTYGWVSGLYTPPGQWSFVALTISSNQAVMYVGTNGVLKASTNAIAHDSEAWNGPVLISADTTSSDRTFNGTVDEVAVFNRTLSATDVASLFSAAIQPQAYLNSQYYAYAGFPFSMTVQTPGTTPVGYQWQKNGNSLVDGGTLTGSHSSTLALSAAAFSDAGTYQVIVTNQSSTYSSSQAALTVLPALGFNGLGGNWTGNATTNSIGKFVNANVLQLTDGGRGEASSTFFNYPVYVGGFQASFTYQDLNGGAADGAAFVVQNDPRGSAALGQTGGALGYGGITNSAAVEFNLYSVKGVGYAFQTNGATGVYNSASPVNIASGDPINVSVLYLNGVLSMTLTDSVAGTGFTTNIAVNVPTVVGTNMAYVGFTGGDGSAVSSQVISNFTFVSLVEMSAQSANGNQLSLSWPGASGGYVLQQNNNLTTGSWVPVPNVGLTNQVTVPTTNSSMFYRLVQPDVP